MICIEYIYSLKKLCSTFEKFLLDFFVHMFLATVVLIAFFLSWVKFKYRVKF